MLAIQNRTLKEENQCYIEKANTLQFENKALTNQKDIIQKRLLQDQSMAEYQFQSNKASRDSILSTPVHSTARKEPNSKQFQAIDDSNVKYGSPTSASAHIMQSHNDDFSRRFSIDSFSRGSAQFGGSLGNQSINVGSYQNMPAINRFNAISENDCEEPTNNHKFLQMSDSTNAMRRLSTLQIRNKQVPKHLQSSYALEDVTQTVDENFVRGQNYADTTYNKENHRMSNMNASTLESHRNSNINAAALKRPHDQDQLEAASQKKTR